MHVTAKDMVQERDEEAQTVIRILAHLDKKWNMFRAKVSKCSRISARVKVRSSDEIENEDFEERVSFVHVENSLFSGRSAYLSRVINEEHSSVLTVFPPRGHISHKSLHGKI